MDGFAPLDCGKGDPDLDGDPLMLSTLADLDGFSELGAGSLAADPTFSVFGLSAAHQVLDAWPSLPSVDSAAENGIAVSEDGGGMAGDLPEIGTGIVPQPIIGVSLPERMIRALAMLKASSCAGGILVQMWMPIRQGDKCVLSTCDQPFLLDQMLAGFREVSRQFMFSATDGPDQFPGLPGRVFMSGMPEWTPNVMYYNRFEYLRGDYAVSHEVRGSLAMPVFEPSGGSCCAVLELAVMREKNNFDAEMDNVCKALQCVNLHTVKARPNPQCLTKNQKSAFTEILHVLRAVCHAHTLPLALTWVPVCSDSKNADVLIKHGCQQLKSGLRNECVLHIQESACYFSDMRMQDFLHACAEHPLEKGQGIVGKALLSNHPFFSDDVRDYDIRDYPLAHHARKFGLRAAVAIRLRSTYTGSDDYIVEFFLPVSCGGSEEQQLLLNNLSRMMERICRSLRTVSDAELTVDDITKALNENGSGTSCSSSDFSINSSRRIGIGSEYMANIPFGNQKQESDKQGRDQHPEELKSSSMTHVEKKRSTAEKNIPLNVLQQYFAGSLKDAAKSIGVCPTTLKRICRQHGISRWPSRKIKKVNRSLKKIQNVINSVQGVDGALKYDQATGCLIAAATSPERSPLISLESRGPNIIPIETEFSLLKSEPDSDEYQMEHPGHIPLSDIQKNEMSEIDVGLNDGGLFPHSNTECTPQWPLFAGTTNNSYLTRKTAFEEVSGSIDLCMEISEFQDTSRGTLSVSPLCGKYERIDAGDPIIEHSLPSTSSMTDSSSGSASSHPTFTKSFKCAPFSESSSTITVKATYEDDMVRFKLLPSMGYQHLLEEIAKRLKLSVGTFRLKYLDDEEEWMILASDADLQECLEILDTIRSHTVKIQVRDVPCAVGSSAVGSSAGSSCLV